MTIHCWKSKPKRNPSRRSNDVNSSSSSSRLSTLSPRRTNLREMTEQAPPLSRTTRIIPEKSSARRILRWQPKKTDKRAAAVVEIPNPTDSKNRMAMSRRRKGWAAMGERTLRIRGYSQGMMRSQRVSCSMNRRTKRTLGRRECAERLKSCLTRYLMIWIYFASGKMMRRKEAQMISHSQAYFGYIEEYLLSDWIVRGWQREPTGMVSKKASHFSLGHAYWESMLTLIIRKLVSFAWLKSWIKLKRMEYSSTSSFQLGSKKFCMALLLAMA